MLHNILSAFAPYLPDLIGWLVTGIVGFLAVQFTRFTGIQIEARDREAFQSALRNGALLALSKGLSGTPAAALVQGYVQSSVPDALRRLAPKPEVLQGVIKAHLAEVLRGVTHRPDSPK